MGSEGVLVAPPAAKYMPRLSLEDSGPGGHGAEREQALNLQSVICKTVLRSGFVDIL